MIKLNDKQKARFVALDYYIGRSTAMGFVEDMPEFKNDTKLQELFNKLYNYKRFGDGDKIENKYWDAILGHLDLKNTYYKLWEEQEELENKFKRGN